MFELRSYLPYLFNRVGFAVSDAFSNVLADVSLTVPAWRVLALLLSDRIVSVSEMAERTSIEISTLSRLLDSLQRRRLISRRSGKLDGRVVNVALTARGHALTTSLVPSAHDLELRLLGSMPADDVATLRRLLEQLYANITASDERSKAGNVFREVRQVRKKPHPVRGSAGRTNSR